MEQREQIEMLGEQISRLLERSDTEPACQAVAALMVAAVFARNVEMPPIVAVEMLADFYARGPLNENPSAADPANARPGRETLAQRTVAWERFGHPVSSPASGRARHASQTDRRRDGTSAPACGEAANPLLTSAPHLPRLAHRTPPSCPLIRPAVGSWWSAKEPHNAGSGEDKMATTLKQTETRTTTYTMLVIFTVHPESDQNLQDQQAIRDEAQSWLESVGATVHGVSIRKTEAAA